MSHYSKVPELLDHLITCSVAEACRRCNITPQTFWNYMVRSRLGDPKFQEIEFCTVVAPLHIQYQNAKTLAAQQIEQNAIERARDGTMTDVFFQGQRMFERVKKEEFVDFTDEQIADFGLDAYELKPTKQWLKPSDALVLKMLESWNKKYRSHQEIDVNYGGTLRLERPEERTATKVIEHKVFDDDTNTEPTEQSSLALARPAKDSAEFDKWNAAGEFASTPTKFVDADGKETVLQAPKRPEIENHPRVYDAVTGMKPERQPPTKVVRIDAGERPGYGKAPPGGRSLTTGRVS